MLYAHIYQAQDLIPADSDGNSDPYLEVSYYGNEGRTETVNDSLNPVIYIFGITLIFQIDFF